MGAWLGFFLLAWFLLPWILNVWGGWLGAYFPANISNCALDVPYLPVCFSSHVFPVMCLILLKERSKVMLENMFSRTSLLSPIWVWGFWALGIWEVLGENEIGVHPSPLVEIFRFVLQRGGGGGPKVWTHEHWKVPLIPQKLPRNLFQADLSMTAPHRGSAHLNGGRGGNSSDKHRQSCT